MFKFIFFLPIFLKNELLTRLFLKIPRSKLSKNSKKTMILEKSIYPFNLSLKNFYITKYKTFLATSKLFLFIALNYPIPCKSAILQGQKRILINYVLQCIVHGQYFT